MIGNGIGIGFQAKKKVIVQDVFNRADNASSMGNANTGQAWTATRGTWGIRSNQAYCPTIPASPNNAFATVDPLTPNVGMSFDIDYTATSQLGGVMRLTNDTNYLYFRLISTDIKLLKNVAGTVTQIGIYSFTPVAGTKYKIKVLCAGDLIKVFIDGIERISVSESFNNTATIHGLFAQISQADGNFDNFLVERV